MSSSNADLLRTTQDTRRVEQDSQGDGCARRRADVGRDPGHQRLSRGAFHTMMRHLMRKALVSFSALLLTQVACAGSYILYAGSYTSGTSKGIYAWRFNSDSGELKSIGLVA